MFSQILIYINCFSRFSLFSKIIFLICSNITISFITVVTLTYYIYFFSIFLTWLKSDHVNCLKVYQNLIC